MNYSKLDTTNGIGRDVARSKVIFGKGYILMPETANSGDQRLKYISNCYRRERVDIMIEDGGTPAIDCFITRSALKDVAFPRAGERLGSGIVFFQDTYTGKIVVFDTIAKNDETTLLEEDVFHIIKGFGSQVVSIKGNAQTGQISIDISGGEGKMDINLRNKAKDASLNLNISGEVSILSDNLNVLKDSIKVGEASEPIPLGDTLQAELNKLKTKLDTLVNAINASPVVPGDGGTSFKAGIISGMAGAPNADFSGINSEKSFID